MRKTTFLSKTFLAAIVLVVCWAGAGWAVPVSNYDGNGDPIDTFEDGTSYGTWTNSGDWLFTASGNNSGSFEDLLEYVLQTGDFNDYDNSLLGDFTSYGNDFELVLTESVALGEDGSSLTVTTEEEDGNTGTYQTDGSYAISLYTVKAGNAFAMYAENPAETYGSWSTFDIWKTDWQGTGGGEGLELSHFNGYNPAPVPEPATMLLFGVGLAGLAGVTRGRIRKKKS